MSGAIEWVITAFSKRGWDMNKIKQIIFNRGSSVAGGIITAVFTLFPEDCFERIVLNKNWNKTTTVVINRLIVCVIVLSAANAIYWIWRKHRKKVTISGKNYSVQIEYGNLLDISGGKAVINFDECYTTNLGEAPGDIKAGSLCGQYLTKHPINNMHELIEKANIKAAKGKSRYNNQTKYIPGTIIPHGKFLLMAFAKLDENGRGYLTYDEYIECLNTLWAEIDLYRGTDDVYVPILGSTITRLDKELSQQDLLDIMISSYRLCSKKIHKPNTLHIVCKKRDGFSLNNVLGVD